MELHEIANLITLANIRSITNYIQTFGILAPLVAFVLFVVQAALPIFPYVILAAAGGILFGFKMGFLLSWLGALAGACLAFWISRLVASEWASRQIERYFGYKVGKNNSGLAFWSILIARVVPVVPTPLINVAAALGGVSFWNFFFSSAIGKIPTAFLYTGLGLALFQTRDIKLGLAIVSIILILLVVGRYYARGRLFNFTKHSH
ncbi:TVP38/TMEM64 family protein [Syntrophomonas erecta]